MKTYQRQVGANRAYYYAVKSECQERKGKLLGVKSAESRGAFFVVDANIVGTWRAQPIGRSSRNVCPEI